MNAAAAKWGRPTTLDQLTSVFLRHLHSEIPDTPFSDGPLSEESQVILPQLEKLAKRGWWTVGSQPAVNSATSTDPVFGWGPRGGYVYQKAFVEFFALGEDVERIISKVESEGKGWLDYFAANLEVCLLSLATGSLAKGTAVVFVQGDFRTSVSDDGRNAVTWGVFPGREIVQTTIIERESFLAWKVPLCTKSLFDVKIAHTLPGCGILTLGGLGFGLSASIARARITRRGSEGEVVGQYTPSRLHPHRFAVGVFIRFIVGKGVKFVDNILSFTCVVCI